MSENLSWSFGLINAAGKYLTAETFGFRINCNAGALKRKQIWFLEADASSDKVYFRSSLGRYLTTTAAGAFNGDAETKGPNEQFEVQVQPDGRWALLSAHGYYAGGSGEKLDAYTKVIAEDRLWIVQLAMHPQVNLKNVNRKRFVHLADNGLHAEEDIPWGDDATLTIVFFEGGKYGLQASNGQYLAGPSGALKANPDPDCRFILKFHGEQVSFQANNNCYLTALGAKGTLRATKDSINKDELWVLQDSHPQLKLKSAATMKRVSVRTGVEVSANQADVTDAEFFQIEINKSTKQWSFRTFKDMFWTVGDDGTITGNAKERGNKEWFDVEWKGDKIAIRASNGKYVATKANGGLIANASAGTSNEATYIWEIINRPRLVLRGEHGFLGTMPSGVVECNKSNPEIFTLHVSAGVAHISGSNGKYWQVNGDNITVSGDKPTDLFLEMVEHSKMLIRFGDKYLQGFQNGGLKFSGTGASDSTLWEY
jgi:fascin 1/2